ncbi:response regulator [Brevundimonas goettingensis]|uniref:Response regulator n=1 Tax=Brevundimonas goettingensis TaxID=2774190 RepID=A0A975GUP0_9CAUL|nr:response regulator [Brevundimonas goettingensis]QTC90446.1 response regulator [Brevundimonas goettingensis]
MTETVPYSRATILITDDDPTLRAIGAELLACEGYRVLEAQDGDEALRLIEAAPVDLLILDMLMPNKDGLETIMELRRRGSEVRILAISSGGSMDINTLLRSAMVFGADRTLSKPLPISTFADTIADMLLKPAVKNDMFT